MPAAPPGGRYFGAKLMGMAGTSATPGVQYVIVLFDRRSSRIAAFVDGNLVTGYRTAATSAAALDRLAPPGPARLAVLGSGLEAAMHVVDREILFAHRDRPPIAERIGDLPGAIAVELIGHGGDEPCAGRHGPLHPCVGIVDVEMHADW